MKTLICGSRIFTDYGILTEQLNKLLPNDCDTIISGGAIGADSLAIRYAKEHNIAYSIVRPEWCKYGKSAGFKRNLQMLDMLNNKDLVIAFIVNNSQGTLHTVENAKKKGIPTVVLKYRLTQGGER